MALMRAAFETRPGVVQLTVLCSGCLNELLERLRRERPNVHSWTKERSGAGGSCEFCVGVATAEAL